MPQISATFSWDNRIEISNDELNVLKNAKEYLQNALAFERNFEFLIFNYIEYEFTIAKISIKDMANITFDRALFNKYITEINVRLLNLFSTFKAYRDKSPSLVNKLCKDKKLFDDLCSSKYDNFFSFRLIDLLRNHAQHNDNPMSLLTLGGEWRGEYQTTQANSEHYTNPIVDTEILRKNKKIKKNILPSPDDKFHLTFCIKQYIECLSSVHKQISETIKTQIISIQQEILTILEPKMKLSDDKIIFVYKNNNYETYYLNCDTYFDLNREHINLSNLSNHCINTKTPKEEKDKISQLNKYNPKP
ncbi:hypothetical protein [Legionella shakespearei]|uniref:Uncharacterized protein n=1 Tax=Legionella shakespearei DSM 23087 TaxID=1122169 RepID=A0A0W0Z0N8_9GAMM|nr:hypothetical protein [Legionella shakespearei]KTD62387.1 hypothetical protein Lsha_1087 [Legionella shakespearei DSM 23087]